LCNYAPNEPNKGDHLPEISRNEIYVCKECVTRAKTVINFGLTVSELKKAADEYKVKLEARDIDIDGC